MSKVAIASTFLAIVLAFAAVSCQSLGSKGPATTTASVDTATPTATATTTGLSNTGFYVGVSALVLALMGFGAFLVRGPRT